MVYCFYIIFKIYLRQFCYTLFYKVCSNGTRVFVEESIAEEFLSQLISRVKMMKIGDPRHPDITVGATIHKNHAEKVLNYVQVAKKEVSGYEPKHVIYFILI